MTSPGVSVIVVSRGRPNALMRCLDALAQQFHPGFELVVVADPAGAAACAARMDADRIRQVEFDTPNIALARNAGICAAGGDIVAFIDDDAVAEPTWLSRLVAPLEDGQVSAAGGFVLGPDGLRYQSRGQAVGADGTSLRIADWGIAPRVFAKGQSIKTEGTNMAFRRTVIAGLGGFDLAFAYYLDETDLNLRLAKAGHRTALVPQAIVHHGLLASERRRADGVPRDLFQIGASGAALAQRHLNGDAGTVLSRLRSEQRKRLLRHLERGSAEPREIARLMGRLDEGLAQRVPGRTLVPLAGTPGRVVRPFRDPRETMRSAFFAGSRRETRWALDRAMAVRAHGDVATIVTLSPDWTRHRVTFGPDGIWRYAGGRFCGGGNWPVGPASRSIASRLQEIARFQADTRVAGRSVPASLTFGQSVRKEPETIS